MAPYKKRVIWTVTALAVIIIGAVVLSVFSIQWMGKQNVQSAEADTASDWLSTDTITAGVIKHMGYENLSKTEENQISRHFVFPEGLVNGSTVYVSNSPESAFEIACFEVADVNYMPQLDTVIADHMVQRASGFKNSPQEYALLQEYTVAHSGVYAFVAVADDAEAAATVFKSIVEQG
ncbi:MAG TPA: DUF4358 domain-containing protein [Candidatus Scatavimonas merdigallinarum]|uniref:DUF4358 domain-containing protein n=1 Tax=Candidatus Scatavimonas merdigallinarum TaxID=2840914 RepID=A0A9D1CTP0_9FIRM|nr:DUF4358 domain-containing protein [Candidatus Scatavimonas merdigallinarum]